MISFFFRGMALSWAEFSVAVVDMLPISTCVIAYEYRYYILYLVHKSAAVVQLELQQ